MDPFSTFGGKLIFRFVCRRYLSKEKFLTVVIKSIIIKDKWNRANVLSYNVISRGKDCGFSRLGGAG